MVGGQAAGFRPCARAGRHEKAGHACACRAGLMGSGAERQGAMRPYTAACSIAIASCEIRDAIYKIEQDLICICRSSPKSVITQLRERKLT